MAKKGKSKGKPRGPAIAAKPSAAAPNDRGRKNGRSEKNNNGGVGDTNRDVSDESSSSSSDDDSLVLEGVLIRNPDASESDSSDGDVSSEEEEDIPMKNSSDEPNRKIASSSNAKKDDSNDNAIAGKTKSQKQMKQQWKRKQSSEPEMVHVEFLFCDVHERFFHGMKTLLHRQGFHAPHSSQLADLIIENEMIGTVLSTDLDSNDNIARSKKTKTPSNGSASAPQRASQEDEANVFGFASIVNLTANHSSSCIQALKCLCLDHCPSEHKTEMETVLSGRTKRPAGFFFHERMVNVPLEITLVLHQQLVLDMDHAVDNANDESEKKSLDYGAFVRLAPCFKSDDRPGGGANGHIVVYKYFDDEVFATNAEFVYNFKAPKSHDHENGDNEELWCSVIVLTKTGHRGAMKELKRMIHGG
ncbi:hypothetical protein ACHAXA_001952 [Cyclostephanos tholiformis]|uniref:Uncharacterized protein n=1 Tax=Cyclostephanos tholiformis TaxID=382380 RepID=A0ABD3R154_9STRA